MQKTLQNILRFAYLLFTCALVVNTQPWHGRNTGGALDADWLSVSELYALTLSFYNASNALIAWLTTWLVPLCNVGLGYARRSQQCKHHASLLRDAMQARPIDGVLQCLYVWRPSLSYTVSKRLKIWPYYYGMQIGNRYQAFKWHHFQW